MGNILDLLKTHHRVMAQTFPVLTDPDALVERKRENLFIFLEVLKMHSKSEAETLYDCMEELDDTRPIALSAREEHEIAERIGNELEALNYQNDWSDEIAAKARVVAELVRHHIGEEEAEVFNVVRENFIDQELEGLGIEYSHRFNQRLEKALARNEGTRLGDTLREIFRNLPAEEDRKSA